VDRENAVLLVCWAFLLSLATWRLTALLYVEDAFRWLRKRLGIGEVGGVMTYPPNWIGALWGCFWCLSLVVALVLSAATAIVGGTSPALGGKMGVWSWFVLWQSSAAGALWIEKRIGAARGS